MTQHADFLFLTTLNTAPILLVSRLGADADGFGGRGSGLVCYAASM